MSTIRLIAPIAQKVIAPVWIFGSPVSSTTSIQNQNGIGEMIVFPDGSIALRNSDGRRHTQPTIYAAYGPSGQALASSDVTIMPTSGPVPSGGTWSVTWGGDTASGLAAAITAVNLAIALNLLTSITVAGGVTVTGSAGGPYTVTFVLNGAQASFTAPANSLLPAPATAGLQCVINIATVAGGSPSTQAIFTLAPAIAAAGAMALVIGPGGVINQSLLGTTLSADSQSGSLNTIGSTGEYCDLPTSIAAALIGGVNYIFAGGRFTSYYLGGSASTMTTFGLVSMATGAALVSFTGGAITLNSSITNQLIAPKVFSDGAGSIGCWSLGSLQPGSSNDTNGALDIVYTFSFSGIVPTGLGSLVKIVYSGFSTLSGNVASYGGQGFDGPFFISTAGAAGSLFASAMFSVAKPASIGGGVFMQDCYFQRPNQDGTKSGSFLGTQSTNGSFSAGTLSLEIIAPIATGWRIIACGGSTGGNFNLAAPTAAAVLAAIQALFPECTCSITANTSTGSTFDVTFHVVQPTNATYLPAINAYYDIYATGQDVQGPLSFYGITASDGSIQNYYPFQGPVKGSNTVGAVLLPISSAVAASGSTVCHCVCYAGGTGLNWIVTIPGVARINISLDTANNLTGQGQNLSIYGAAQAPVSIVPFKNGYAIALPYAPVFSGSAGDPVGYAANPAVSGASTVILSSPILVIDSSGNIDTSFDAACASNFFSLSRSDGARFGPASLLVKGGNLYFGSFYIPTYINMAANAALQIDSQGDLAIPPVWSPFSAPGPGLEVLCACTTTGAKALPPAHP